MICIHNARVATKRPLKKPKDQVVNLRLSVEQKERFERAAAKLEIPLSEFLRAAAREKAEGMGV